MRDITGKFTKGNKGRPAGVKNKTPNEVKELLSEAILPELEKLPEYLAKLDIPDRLRFIAQCLPYILPKLQAVTVTNESEFKLPEVIVLPANNSKPPIYNESDIIDTLP